MKNLTVLIIYLSLILTELQAQGINFVGYERWQDVLALAKEENKLIFLHAYAAQCEQCKEMESTVFADELVGKEYNANFINVKIDAEKEKDSFLSMQLNPKEYPLFLFMNYEGKVLHKDAGAIAIPDFIRLAQIANNPEKQFLTIKLKARRGRLSPKDFIDWATLAQRTKDPDLDEVVSAYLAYNSYSILDQDNLTIILYYAKYLNEKQLAELKKNRKKIMKVVELTEAEFDMIYLNKVLHFAFRKAKQTDSVSYDAYRAAISVYLPKQADKETKRLKLSHQLGAGTIDFAELIATPDKDMLQTGGEYYYKKAENQTDSQKIHFNRAKQFYLKLSGLKRPEQKLAYRYLIYINSKLNEIDPTNYFGVVERLKESISFREKFMSEYPSDSTYTKADQSDDYGALAYFQLFIRNYKEAVESAKRGLEINPDHDWINRSLALGYLLSRQFDKAEPIYLAFMDKFPPADFMSFKETLLQDFDHLETEGIIAPSQPEIYEPVCKIRKLLNQKPGVH